MNTRGLLLAKCLLESGEQVLRAQGPFDAAMALLSLHDGVEFALAATSAQFGVTGVKVEKFEHYWKALPTLCMKIEMDRMNKARVDLKHHLNTPDREDVAEHFRNCRALLGKVAVDYYKLDFESLSLVSIVSDATLRSHLQSAEANLVTDQVREALIECARAWDWIVDRQASLYSQSWLVTYGLPQGMSQAVSERIKAEVVHLHHQIKDLSRVVLAQTFGLNLVEFQFLREILPAIRGKEITFSPGVPDGVSTAMVKRCIELLAKYSIRLLRELGAEKHPAWMPPS
jgi:hypothetical protein